MRGVDYNTMYDRRRNRMPQLPQIKFVKESEMGDGPFMIGDIEVTDELLEKVEAYIQEEIEMMHKPTVLH